MPAQLRNSFAPCTQEQIKVVPRYFRSYAPHVESSAESEPVDQPL